MAVEIVMPRMSDTMEEGRIVRWLKRPGETVGKGEPLAEIETDKAVMQLESYEAGTLARTLLAEGDTAPIGQPIALIEAALAGEVAAPVPSAPAAVDPIAPSARARPPASAQAPEVSQPGPSERLKASPIARRMAEEQGIDLALVRGSGPGGRVTREDVEDFLARRGDSAEQVSTEKPIVATPPAAVQPVAVPPRAPSTEGQTVELSRMRRAIGQRMVESKTTIPHFYVTSDVDMAEAMALRQKLNAAWAPETVGVNDLIVRAVGLAIRLFPDVNASYRDGRVVRHGEVNVGIAVALPDEGLLVPIVRDADRKVLREIARETKGLVERARAGRPLSGDLLGGTFTISNLGMYDVEEFIAIVTPPEAAILAVASVRPVPVVVDGQVGVSQRMKVTLSGDHRVFAGETAARFLQELKRLLGNPLDLLQ